MAKEKIIVVEDEKNIVELLKYNLEEQGYLVTVEMRGDDALERIQKEEPDLVILDLMLPELDGLEICKILKREKKTANIPVIMLTAKSEEIDKVMGLELGADDYVTKPFSPRELLARVKAVLRRGSDSSSTDDEVLVCGVLEMDLGRHIVTLKEKNLDLTSKEYDLLKALMEANGRVLSRENLLEQVWGYDKSIKIETRTVDMHIGQLRKKLKSESHRIATIVNVGYRFDYEA